MNGSQEHEQRFLEAYDAYADAIFRHIAFRIGDRELGKDLMQETFMKVWECLTKGQEIDNIRAFLYRVANNLLIDLVRRKKRRTEVSLEDLQETGFDIESEPEDPRNAIDAERVIAVLQHIEEPYRTALVLRHIDGLPPKEISELLGVSANVASVRINRGLEKLRSLLKDHD